MQPPLVQFNLKRIMKSLLMYTVPSRCTHFLSLIRAAGAVLLHTRLVCASCAYEGGVLMVLYLAWTIATLLRARFGENPQ
jgi:hypothetical protein